MNTELADTSPSNEQLAVPTSESRWPLVIGTIAVLYAALGLIVNILALLGALIGPWLAARLAGIEPLPMPAFLILGQLVLVLALLAVGVLLLVSGIGTLKRRSRGPRGINLWVVLRLALLVVAVLFQVITLNANVDWQLASQEAYRDVMRRNGVSEEQILNSVPQYDADELRTRTTVWALSFTGMLAVCPIVLGLVLSSKRIREEWRAWP